MSKVITIDQSLAKFAWMIWEDGKYVDYGVWKTGSSSAKTKKKDVVYLNTPEERIEYLSGKLLDLVITTDPEMIISEGLSFGSMGDATRQLAGLFYTMKYATGEYVEYDQWLAYAPTSLKAFAREYLPEGDKLETSKKTGKEVKVKMDKKLMVKAARQREGEEFLSQYNYSTGLDDLADAYWIGKKYYQENN